MAEFQKKIETSKIIKDQLLEFKMRLIKRYQEEQLEGQLIKRQAEEAMMQERQKEIERKEHMEQQKKSFKKANEELVK